MKRAVTPVEKPRDFAMFGIRVDGSSVAKIALRFQSFQMSAPVQQFLINPLLVPRLVGFQRDLLILPLLSLSSLGKVTLEGLFRFSS
jgi:hypothetical protein